MNSYSQGREVCGVFPLSSFLPLAIYVFGCLYSQFDDFMCWATYDIFTQSSVFALYFNHVFLSVNFGYLATSTDLDCTPVSSYSRDLTRGTSHPLDISFFHSRCGPLGSYDIAFQFLVFVICGGHWHYFPFLIFSF